MAQTPALRRLGRLAAGYNRKAEQLGMRGRISAQDLALIEALIDHCVYCGVTLEPGQGSFDHVVPFGRGGRNAVENVARCCMTCQRRKFNKTPAEYQAHKALLVTCSVCGKVFQPRWAEYQRGDARVCSRSCSGRRRWELSTSERSTPAPDARDGRPTRETRPSRTPRPTSKST